jgi:hypothetical protein
MRSIFRFRFLALAALLISLTGAAIAQGHSDHDKDRGNLPPGQAKKMEQGGQKIPPGQAKKYFRDENRVSFYAHYRGDADKWRARKRPVFIVGERIAPRYVVRPVPRSVWINIATPPPAGYRYGYYGGYVVAYNPTTRIVADVLDLIDAARSR